MFWIDTHAHIYLDQFNKDRNEAIARAQEANVGQILMPNIDHTSVDAMLKTYQRFPKVCLPMMGLHPCSVKADFQRELYVVEEWLHQPNHPFIGVGEIGTDLYWDKTFFDQQKEALTIQVQWAKKLGLPIVIHCRESIPETIDLLKPLADADLKGVFHCFTGTLEQAQAIVEMGFYLGIGGVATFKNGGLDKVLPAVEASRLLLETDCPYLAPVPHRGKRNESSYVPLIAQKVAEITQTSLAELAAATTTNAQALFSLV